MIKLLFTGNFHSNHSLSIVNRNLLKWFKKSEGIKMCDEQEEKIDIELRHTYPPNFKKSNGKKLILIIPWEFVKVPLEWIINIKHMGIFVIVPSLYTKNIFMSCGIDGDNIYVIPNGYDSSIFTMKKKEQNNKRFLFVGSGIFRKGLDILFDVWDELKLKDSVLVIKDSSHVYGKSIQKTNLLQNVEFINEELNDAEMRKLYQSCDVLVSPYRGESFGMAIIEGMACGLFPLVSKNGPSDEYVKDEHCKISSVRRHSNIYDIGGGKVGDSFSPMGEHCYHWEPIKQCLQNQILKLSKMKNLPSYDTSSIMTWKDVSFKYILLFYNLCH